MTLTRGQEIAAWLNEHDAWGERLAILDDDTDMDRVREWHVPIDFDHGIQDHHVVAALRLLGLDAA